MRTPIAPGRWSPTTASSSASRARSSTRGRPSRRSCSARQLTDETAEWVGSWADGLVTVGKEPEDLRKTLDAFRSGGWEGKPVFVQACVAYAPDEADAVRAAHRNWPMAGLDIPLLGDLATPEAFADRCRSVTLDEVREKFRVSADLSRHADWITRDLELGATRVYLQHVGPDIAASSRPSASASFRRLTRRRAEVSSRRRKSRGGRELTRTGGGSTGSTFRGITPWTTPTCATG